MHRQYLSCLQQDPRSADRVAGERLETCGLTSLAPSGSQTWCADANGHKCSLHCCDQGMFECPQQSCSGRGSVPFHIVTAGITAAGPALKTPLPFTVCAVTSGSWWLSGHQWLSWWLSPLPLQCSNPHLEEMPPPQPYHPQYYQCGPDARDESTFPATLVYGEPQRVYFSRNLGFKASRRLGLS